MKIYLDLDKVIVDSVLSKGLQSRNRIELES